MTSLFNPISYTIDSDEDINAVKKCFWKRDPYNLPKNDHPIEKISHHF